MKSRSIVIVFMIVGIMTALAQADEKQRDRIREQKKIYKQLLEQKRDQLREQKQDGSCQEEDVLKAIGDVEPDQDRTRTREQKKIREHICDQTCDQTCDQVRDQKQDQLREQKQDGSCQEEDEAFLVFLKSVLGEEDSEPDQDRTRTRERKKICEHICDQTCEQPCDQVRDQKRDQLREKKQDGSCQEENVLKASDGEPVQDRIRTREQKKDGTGGQNRHKIRDQIWRKIKRYLM